MATVERPTIQVDSAPFECLRCHRILTGISNMTGLNLVPESAYEALEIVDGAANVCIYCASVAIFVIDRGNIKLRYPRADERLALAQNVVINTLVKGIRWKWLVDLLAGREMWNDARRLPVHD